MRVAATFTASAFTRATLCYRGISFVSVSLCLSVCLSVSVHHKSSCVETVQQIELVLEHRFPRPEGRSTEGRSLKTSFFCKSFHWRQRRRGCRGHIPPPNILVGGTSTGISPQYYYVLSDIADHYWLPYVRSASSRFHSAIRRHQFASVRQADSRLTRLVPPTLNSR